MTALIRDFSGLLYYNPAANGFNPIAQATISGPDNMDEGATETWDLVTWDIPDGVIYWKIIPSGDNLTASRFTDGLTGTVSVVNKRASLSITVSADNLTSVTGQSFDIQFSKTQNGAAFATKYGVNVNDTSQDPQLLVMDLDPKNYTTGSSISDASGQSHSGTLVAAPTFTSAGTNGDGNYFTLNGTSQYIVVPSLQNSTYQSITMMLWFNPSNTDGSLITKELSYKMRLSSSHLNVMATHTGSVPWGFNTTDNSVTVNNNWHHIAVTIASDFIDWYYDGNRFHHEAGIGTLGANTQPLMIGSYGSGTSEFFTGKIGPARLYNYALSSSDISAYFNSTRSRYQATEPNSLIFNGSSDYREVLGTPTDWALGTTWTIEWWSKATSASGPSTIYTVMSQYDNSGGIGIDIYYQNGNLIINNGTTLATEPTPGVWTHVSLVNNAGTMTLYYDGTSVHNGGNWNLGLSTSTLVLGKRGHIPYQYFAGKLTNIRITNTAVYTGTFDPFVTSYPPGNVTGTRLLMNPTGFNTILDLSNNAHTFGGSCGAGNDYPVPPTYSLATAGSVTSINEGSALTFNVTTTNVADGTLLYFYLDSTGAYEITAGRFSAGSGTSFTVNNNTGTFDITVSADSTTATDTQSYNIQLSSTFSPPTFVGNTVGITVNDSSQTPANPTYSLSPAASSINEGSGLTFNVTTTNVADGTYYWTINHTTTSNADFSAVSGSFSITSNSGSFTITPSADNTTEGSETCTVSIRSGSTSGTVLATSSSITVNDTSLTPALSIPTGNIVGQWNSPASGQFGTDPIIWPEAGGYSWAKVYHLAAVTPASNGTIGYAGDGSTSYIQVPIIMSGGEFTFAFTAKLNPTGTFPQGIFDASCPGGYTGLRARWTDATHIEITQPGTGTAAIDMTGSGWHTYGPSFFTVRMKLDSLAGTGSIDIFVNGTAWANIGAPRGASGFSVATNVNMILGALYKDDNTGQVSSLDSTWFNFIYYSRALTNSEVTQLYTAQQAGLLNPVPATTYSFSNSFNAAQHSNNIYINIGYAGVGPTVPPESMAGWYVSGPGIADVATVTAATAVINDSQFYVTIDTSILMASGTYTFTAP